MPSIPCPFTSLRTLELFTEIGVTPIVLSGEIEALDVLPPPPMLIMEAADKLGDERFEVLLE